MLTFTLTFELIVDPSAPSATLTTIGLMDDPSTETVALLFTSTLPTVPDIFISIFAGTSTIIFSTFPPTSNLKLLSALMIWISLISAVSGITI